MRKMFPFSQIGPALLAALLSSLAADASLRPPVNVDVDFSGKSRLEAKITLNEKKPGRLEDFIRSLDGNASGRVSLTSASGDISISCETRAGLSSCRVALKESARVLIGEDSFASTQKLEGLKGAEVVFDNLQLTIPLTLSEGGGASFDLSLGFDPFAGESVISVYGRRQSR